MSNSSIVADHKTPNYTQHLFIFINFYVGFFALNVLLLFLCFVVRHPLSYHALNFLSRLLILYFLLFSVCLSLFSPPSDHASHALDARPKTEEEAWGRGKKWMVLRCKEQVWTKCDEWATNHLINHGVIAWRRCCSSSRKLLIYLKSIFTHATTQWFGDFFSRPLSVWKCYFYIDTLFQHCIHFCWPDHHL